MTTARDPAGAPSAKAGRRHERKALARLIAAALLGALLTLFAVLNSQTVRVHWIVTTTGAPLIVVIAVCGLVGAAITALLGRRRRSRRAGRDASTPGRSMPAPE